MANIVEIIIKGVDKASKAFKQTDKASKSLKDSLAKLAVVGAGAAAVAMTLKKSFDMAKEGALIDQARIALEGYAGGVREAELATRAVEEASSGLLSVFEATQAATKFLSMGLAETADEAGELAKTAVTLGASMGVQAGPAIENFALMLANVSIPRMDSFGLSADATRVRMEELASIYPGMSRSQRFLTTVQEQGKVKLGQLAGAGFEAGTTFEKLDTLMQNLTESGKTLAFEALEPLAQGILDLNTIVEDSSYDFEGLIENMRSTSPVMNTLLGAAEAVGDVLGWLRTTAEEMGGGTRAAADDVFELNKMLRESKTVAEGAAIANLGLVSSLAAVSEAEIATALLGELAEQFEKTKDTEAYEKGVRAVLSAYTDLTPAQIDTRIALEDWKAELLATNPELGLMLAQAYSLGDALRNIPEYTEMEIRIRTMFEGGAAIPSGIPAGGFSTWAEGIAAGYKFVEGKWVPSTGYQHGGSGIVPPGYPGDTYPLMVSSGERFQITPAEQTTYDSSRTTTIAEGAVQVHVGAGAEVIETQIAFEDSLVRALEELG